MKNGFTFGLGSSELFKEIYFQKIWWCEEGEGADNRKEPRPLLLVSITHNASHKMVAMALH